MKLRHRNTIILLAAVCVSVTLIFSLSHFSANNSSSSLPPLLAIGTKPNLKQVIVEAEEPAPESPAEQTTPSQQLPATEAPQQVQTPMLQTGATLMVIPTCNASRSVSGMVSLYDLSNGPPVSAPGGTVTYQWEFSGPTAGVTGLPPTHPQTVTIPAGSNNISVGSYALGNVTQEIMVRIHISAPQSFTHSWVPIPPPCSTPY